MAESEFTAVAPLDGGHDRTPYDCGVPALNLYFPDDDTLDRVAPSPLNSLNRAVVEAYLHGPRAGLERLASVLPENVPARYPGWHAEIGELHFRLGRHSAAERAWRESLRFTTARADREFLRRRLAACRPDGGEPATE